MLFWIDTETSGLNPQVDQLLEFVCVVTTDNLEYKEQFGPFTVEPSILGKPMKDWDDIVFEMHSKNGLIAEIYEGSVIQPEILDDNCRDWLELRFPELEGKALMAGSTIGFDRSFLKRWMPRTERFFHYRSIDISSVKELAKVWNKFVYDLRPAVTDDEKAHRALDDIHASIGEARYYKDYFFKLGKPLTNRQAIGDPNA